MNVELGLKISVPSQIGELLVRVVFIFTVPLESTINISGEDALPIVKLAFTCKVPPVSTFRVSCTEELVDIISFPPSFIIIFLGPIALAVMS